MRRVAFFATITAVLLAIPLSFSQSVAVGTPTNVERSAGESFCVDGLPDTASQDCDDGITIDADSCPNGCRFRRVPQPTCRISCGACNSGEICTQSMDVAREAFDECNVLSFNVCCTVTGLQVR